MVFPGHGPLRELLSVKVGSERGRLGQCSVRPRVIGEHCDIKNSLQYKELVLPPKSTQVK